uniref:Uncharacterized protein n=1 Tax=Hucho hucho TaxID=62062 RepID=A0A4W5PHT4_9TELE
MSWVCSGSISVSWTRRYSRVSPRCSGSLKGHPTSSSTTAGCTPARDLEFERDQQSHHQAHHQAELLRLSSAHQDIVAIMPQVHKTFPTDGPEIQQHWVVHTETLQELSKAINGDSKTSPNPLFCSGCMWCWARRPPEPTHRTR